MIVKSPVLVDQGLGVHASSERIENQRQTQGVKEENERGPQKTGLTTGGGCVCWLGAGRKPPELPRARSFLSLSFGHLAPADNKASPKNLVFKHRRVFPRMNRCIGVIIDL